MAKSRSRRRRERLAARRSWPVQVLAATATPRNSAGEAGPRRRVEQSPRSVDADSRRGARAGTTTYGPGGDDAMVAVEGIARRGGGGNGRRTVLGPTYLKTMHAPCQTNNERGTVENVPTGGDTFGKIGWVHFDPPVKAKGTFSFVGTFSMPKTVLL